MTGPKRTTTTPSTLGASPEAAPKQMWAAEQFVQAMQRSQRPDPSIVNTASPSNKGSLDALATLDLVATDEALHGKILSNGLKVGIPVIVKGFIYQDGKPRSAILKGDQSVYPGIPPGCLAVEWTDGPADNQKHLKELPVNAVIPTQTMPSGSLKKGDQVIIQGEVLEVKSKTEKVNRFGDRHVHFTNGTFMEYEAETDVLAVYRRDHTERVWKEQKPGFAVHAPTPQELSRNQVFKD